ncbi:HlyC/CorC family transporter [Desulfosoma caldarium]|uniref:Mg2+/Co2+ transporter CorB n=1 Tax=Desulfosoma caldarium TaxID=610254 RepID=A0A3N1UQ32_9BACT|nr:CNNM domain-containing protein [Desulfosoma caldarium]ROQ93244.1 Mg2+/Co2+ transporter CorB [Desulfosoma caldarium]
MVKDIAILVLLLGLSAFFSGSETAFMAVDRIRLRHRARTDKRARHARGILKEPEKLISALLFYNNLINVAMSALATALAIQFLGDKGVLVATGVTTLCLLLFGEITPKTVSVYYAERIVVAVAPALLWCIRLSYPIVHVLSLTANGLIRLIGVRRPSRQLRWTEEEIAMVIKAGTEEGILDLEKQDMLLGILSMEKVQVGDIAVPLRDVVSVSLDATYEEVYRMIETYKYARYPVYRGDPSNIVGFIHARDFFLYAKGPSFRLTSIVRPPNFVPELRSIRQQLLSFKKERAHLSIVVDEYGEITGIVTMEDVLEEIVGDIQDEHDPQRRWVRKVGENTYIVEGRLLVRDLNRWLRFDLPEEGVKTVGGLVQKALGRIPHPGDEVVLKPYRLRVLEMRGKSVRKIRLDINGVTS